jgi:excisionase family DNA binding protein
MAGTPLPTLAVVSLDDLRALLSEASANAPRPALLTTEALAHELSTSTDTVRRLRDQGMPYVRVGTAPRYDLAAVRAWLERRPESDVPK